MRQYVKKMRSMSVKVQSGSSWAASGSYAFGFAKVSDQTETGAARKVDLYGGGISGVYAPINMQIDLEWETMWSCSLGEYGDRCINTDTCKQCPVGKYADVHGLYICKECEAGKSYVADSSQSSASYCQTCR